MIPDDTVLTYGELKRWFALYGSDLARADAHHTIILGILAMREPDYPGGTVVKDACGDWYIRMDHQTWQAFGTTASYPDEVPLRPLTVKT
jgi:hypothetical protein